MAWVRRHVWHILGAHAAAAVAVLVAFLLGAFSAGVSSYVKIDVRAHGGATVTLQVPKAIVDAVKGAAPERGMKDETPPAVPATVLDAAQKQQDAFAAADQLPAAPPDAAPFQRGCETRIVSNYSSRRGVAPRIFALHYTVSPNRPGRSDVTAVDVWFDSARAQASSNYVIDGEGYCDYIVPEASKAWAQAAYNPVAISVEVVNTGHEQTYIAPAGLSKLAEVASDSLCRWGIPIRLGAVSGGLVLRSGIVDHNMLGLAGGGHHDITPYKVTPVIAAIKQARAKYGCMNGRPGKPTTKAQRLAKLRAAIHAQRLAGATWAEIKRSRQFRQYVALGGR